MSYAGDSIEVTPSAAVGKQVFASTVPVMLHSVIVTPAAVSAATVIIRDGESSGTVKLTVNSPAGESCQFDMGCKKFTKGMHVKITPANAKAYLLIK